MAITWWMRRVPPADLDRDLADIEAGFAAVSADSDRYRTEVADGTLCSLGEEWDFVHAVLTGQRHQPTDAAGLPVLGGRPLGQVGPSDRDMLIGLPAEGVAAAAEFLRTADLPALMEQNRDALAARTGGILPDTFLRAILTHLENLRRFYGLAAEAGQAVVKRAYA